MKPAAVIAIGSPFRRDDGVGHVAAEDLRPLLPEADVLCLDGEPTRLVDAWAGRRLAVVIDAVRSGRPAGTLHRVEVGVDAFPAAGMRPSTHGFGLAEAVALGDALDLRPDALIVYGVEPEDLSTGSGLSAPVRAAVPALVARVAAEVKQLCA